MPAKKPKKSGVNTLPLAVLKKHRKELSATDFPTPIKPMAVNQALKTQLGAMTKKNRYSGAWFLPLILSIFLISTLGVLLWSWWKASNKIEDSSPILSEQSTIIASSSKSYSSTPSNKSDNENITPETNIREIVFSNNQTTASTVQTKPVIPTVNLLQDIKTTTDDLPTAPSATVAISTYKTEQNSLCPSAINVEGLIRVSAPTTVSWQLFVDAELVLDGVEYITSEKTILTSTNQISGVHSYTIMINAPNELSSTASREVQCLE
jgi:cytoskeletal protein RodZ